MDPIRLGIGVRYVYKHSFVRRTFYSDSDVPTVTADISTDVGRKKLSLAYMSSAGHQTLLATNGDLASLFAQFEVGSEIEVFSATSKLVSCLGLDCDQTFRTDSAGQTLCLICYKKKRVDNKRKLKETTTAAKKIAVGNLPTAPPASAPNSVLPVPNNPSSAAPSVDVHDVIIGEPSAEFHSIESNSATLPLASVEASDETNEVVGGEPSAEFHSIESNPSTLPSNSSSAAPSVEVIEVIGGEPSAFVSTLLPDPIVDITHVLTAEPSCENATQEATVKYCDDFFDFGGSDWLDDHGGLTDGENTIGHCISSDVEEDVQTGDEANDRSIRRRDSVDTQIWTRRWWVHRPTDDEDNGPHLVDAAEGLVWSRPAAFTDNVDNKAVSLSSDKRFCYYDVTTITVICLSSGNKVNINSDDVQDVAINPVHPVLAVKVGGSRIIVCDFVSRATLKTHDLGASVLFVKWVSKQSLAIVTSATVYMWPLVGAGPPARVFDVDASVAGADLRVLDCKVSEDDAWILLSATKGTSLGILQLYSHDDKKQWVFNGTAGAFYTKFVASCMRFAHLLMFTREAVNQSAGELVLIEIGYHGPSQLQHPTTIIALSTTNLTNNPAMTIHVSKTQALVYVTTALGYLMLVDIFSGKLVYSTRITMDTVFSATGHTASGGILAITRKGQVLQVSLNEDLLVPYIVDQLRDSQLAMDMASRLNLSGADGLFVSRLNSLIAAGDVQGAAKVAADSPRGILRTFGTILRFKQCKTSGGVFEFGF